MEDGCRGLEGLADDLDLSEFRGSGHHPHFTTDEAMTEAMHPSADTMTDFFFPRLDHLSSCHASNNQMTDLTNSLPRLDDTANATSLSAQAILAKLDCADLGSSLSEAAPQHCSKSRLDTELLDSVYDAQGESASKTLEPTDVYGRVTCYDGKIILQLRLLNLNTNFPINVSECWLCRDKLPIGSQMYAHKHMFKGVFQVNDEYIHLIIPEPDVNKSVFQSFDVSEPTKFSHDIAGHNNDLEFRDELSTDDNFTLPYMAHAFGLDTKIDYHANTCSTAKAQSGYVNTSSSPGHDMNTAVDNIYSMYSGGHTGDGSTSFPSTQKSNLHLLSKATTSSNSLLQSLDSISSHRDTKLTSIKDTIGVKRPETGARKRKSKAQRKASFIRMKQDIIPDQNVASILSNLQKKNKINDENEKNSIEISKLISPSKALSVGSVVSSSAYADTTLFQRSKKQLDDKYNIVKKIMDKSENISCKICNEKFGRNLSGYKKHMVSVHKEPENSIYECPICLRKFGYNKHLIQHVRIHLGMKLFKCDKCGIRYGREETLKRHLMMHSNKRPYACSVCPKSFTRAEYLVAHMQAHNRTRHVCDKCGVICSSKFNLEIHIKKHAEEKPFVCELCNKSFVRSDFLDNHMEVIHKRNKPKCTICNKSFSRKDVLKRHMTTHSKPTFDCKFCLRSFSRKDRLISHKKTHEVNNELKCFKCPASFHRREVLLKHQKLHETKEQCHVCFKFAASKEKLLTHLKWHEKDSSTSKNGSKNSHVCETCGKALTTRNLLKKHVKNVHGRQDTNDVPEPVKRDKKFVCDICSKGFTRSCNLRTHLLKVHTTKPSQDEEEDDPDDLDSLNSALNKSRRNHQSNLVDLSSWTSGQHHKSESYISQLSNTINSGRSLLAVTNTGDSKDATGWYSRSGSASPASHLPANLSLPQLSSQHPHSPINLSAEAITAAAYLLAYPSYLGPYQ